MINCLNVQKRVPGTLYLHKKRKMSTAPLDPAPERRTQECSPRSRAGDRFWSQSSDTYRQAIGKRNVGPLAECDRSCSSTRFNL